MAAEDDLFGGARGPLDGPARQSETVSPSDTVDLTTPSRGIYVGVTGNITVIMLNGTTQLFSNVPVGVLPVRVTRVKATGTTATNMVALV